MSRQTGLRRVFAVLTCLALALPTGMAKAKEWMPGLDTRTELLLLDPVTSATLTLPPGAGTGRALAVVMLLPDADGPGARSAIYGQRLLENGVALLEPDFAGALDDDDRPLPPAATRLALSRAAIAADPRLDPQRLVLLGLGEGARAALLGQAGIPAGLPMALLYPGCDPALAAAAARAPAAPVLLLHGDADAANEAAACARLAAAFPRPEAVRHRLLAGASYGWDAYDMVPTGGLTRLPDPAGSPHRTWSRPDLATTMIAADRVLGFVLATVGR